MNYSYYATPLRSDELYHHGIKGQKWGVRRFQNADGTRTAAGRQKYKESVKSAKQQYKQDKAAAKAEYKANKPGLSDNQKTALKVGATVAAAGLAAYGGYKIFGGKHNATTVAAKALISKGSQATKTALSNAGTKAVSEIKSSAKAAPGAIWSAAKQGAKKGVNDAAKVVGTGAAIYGTKKYLEKKYGKETANEIIQTGRKPFPKK